MEQKLMFISRICLVSSVRSYECGCLRGLYIMRAYSVLSLHKHKSKYTRFNKDKALV